MTKKILTKAVVPAQEFVATLSEKQWIYYNKKITEEVKDQFENYYEDKKNKKIYTRWESGLEFFFGNINKTQEKWILEFIEKNHKFYELRIRNKELLASKFVKVKDNKKDLNLFVEDIILSPEKHRFSPYQNQFKEFQNAQKDLVWKILKNLDQDQKKYFKNKLQQIQEDLISIAN